MSVGIITFFSKPRFFFLPALDAERNLMYNYAQTTKKYTESEAGMTKVFIDGSAGTTGLRIRERLSARRDLELIELGEERRKDPEARRDALNRADIAFLCLPDAAAKEAVGMIENPAVAVIDTSTAHRTAAGWVYGFPELTGLREKIRTSKRIANPGCHATGFISIVYPLVKTGLLSPETPLSCFSLTGYSGGGKKMIAQYEAPDRPGSLSSPGIYATAQRHKHLPEMVRVCGLAAPPVFCPIVDDYYKGMAVTVPLHSSIAGGVKKGSVRYILEDFYHSAKLVTVAPAEECDAASTIYANAKAGTDSLKLIVAGTDDNYTITALFNNLGKGASGAAIENMNLVLGLDPTTGLVV